MESRSLRESRSRSGFHDAAIVVRVWSIVAGLGGPEVHQYHYTRMLKQSERSSEVQRVDF